MGTVYTQHTDRQTNIHTHKLQINIKKRKETNVVAHALSPALGRQRQWISCRPDTASPRSSRATQGDPARKQRREKVKKVVF